MSAKPGTLPILPRIGVRRAVSAKRLSGHAVLVVLGELSVVGFHDPFDPFVYGIVECYVRPVLLIVPSPGQMHNRVTPVIGNVVQDIIVVFPASYCSRLLPVKGMQRGCLMAQLRLKLLHFFRTERSPRRQPVALRIIQHGKCNTGTANGSPARRRPDQSNSASSHPSLSNVPGVRTTAQGVPAGPQRVGGVGGVTGSASSASSIRRTHSQVLPACGRYSRRDDTSVPRTSGRQRTRLSGGTTDCKDPDGNADSP